MGGLANHPGVRRIQTYLYNIKWWSFRFNVLTRKAFAKGRFSEKGSCSFKFCPNTSTPSPHFGQLVPLFFNAKNVDLSDIQKDSLSKKFLKLRQNTCFVGHVYIIKNSFKFKLLAFWRKKTPFIGQKYTYENVTKNLGKPPPPLIWTKSKRRAFFFSGDLPLF